MSTTTPEVSGLEELRSRQTNLQQEIRTLIAERDQSYAEFQARLTSEVGPTEDEVRVHEARKNHEDPAIRATEAEVRAFEARLSSGPSEEEVRAFNSQHAERGREVRSKLDQLAELDERVGQEERLDHSLGLAQRASRSSAGLEVGRIESQRDPATYRQDNQWQNSYFLDLAAMQSADVRGRTPHLEGYDERLSRHAKEMADLVPERWAARKAQAEARIDQAENEFRGRVGLSKSGFEVSPFERFDPGQRREEMQAALEQRAPSRIVGQGGSLTLAAA